MWWPTSTPAARSAYSSKPASCSRIIKALPAAPSTTPCSPAKSWDPPGLGQGIAIPHGRIKGLKAPVGAFCRLISPVQFDAPDGKPVGLVFILLVPEAANEHHLQLLSELAQMFSDKAFRDQLGEASDAAALHGLFANWHAN
jgi:mannitol/fructose-specific phosphotransferase system IIA component (Ntr-type)